MFEDKSLAAGWEDDWLVVRIKNPEADVVGDIEGADSETAAPIGAQASLINTGETGRDRCEPAADTTPIDHRGLGRTLTPPKL